MSENQIRSPGRPRGGRAFERSDIVAAALEAIAEVGYAGLSMRGVARSIGASLATVQRHFATKDELWQGAIDDFLDGFAETPLAMSGDSLDQAIEQLLGRGSEHPGLIAALVADRAPGNVERWEYIADRIAARHDDALAFIAALKDTGAVRDVNAHALLMLLNLGVGAISGASIAAREVYGFDLEDPGARSRLAQALADILRLGLVAR